MNPCAVDSYFNVLVICMAHGASSSDLACFFGGEVLRLPVVAGTMAKLQAVVVP